MLIKHIWRFSHRTLRLALEIGVVLLILLAIALGVFMWRLSEGPLSVAFAKDYIEEAISNEAKEFYVRFDDIVFTWPEFTGPFQLDVTGLRVQKGEKADANELSIDNASIGLSRRALFFGRIRPVSVVLKGPSVELVRTEDGQLNLFLQQKEVTKEDAPGDGTPANIEVAQFFKDMATRTPGGGNFMSRLRSFVIEDASVAVRDHQYGLSWYLTDLDFSISEHDQGVAASIIVDLPGGRDKDANISADMVYRKKTNDFRASAHIQNINPYFIARFLPVPEELNGQNLFFSGELEAGMDENLMLTEAKMVASIPEGRIVVPAEYDEPIGIRNIEIESDYNKAEDLFTLSKLSGEIGGIPFTGGGSVKFGENTLSVPITLNVAEADLKSIPPLFPKSERDGQAYKWLGRNVSTGMFHDVSLKMELSGTKTRDQELSRDVWDVDMPSMILDFAFENATVQYEETLMPATNAKGKGTLDLGAETLVIEGESAMIGDLQGSDIFVKVSHLMSDGEGFVEIKTKVKGPLGTAVQYIGDEPIGMNKEHIGIDYKDVKGSIDVDVGVSLPTIKDVPKEDVKVEITGTATDIMVPNVVEGLSVSGGPVNIATEEGGFRVKGKARLEGREADMEWHQYFDSAGRPYSMQVKASIGADQQLRNHFGVNLDEYISGTLPVNITYQMKGADSSVDVVGDLNPVRLYIKPFKYEKSVGVPGDLSLKATLKDNVMKDITGLNIKTKGFAVADGKIGFAPRGDKKADLHTGSFPGASIGRTAADVSFAVDKAGVMNITAKGSMFDAEPFLRETESSDLHVQAQTKAKEKVQPMKITLNAPTMLLKNEQAAKDAKLYLEMDNEGDFTRMEYDAGVGKGKLHVRFSPDAAGKRVFRLDSNDAGNVLYAFGLYENVHGGRLIIYGEPKGGDLRGDLYGSMRMENFRVVKAPALASLLSLMSLGGVRDLLGNEGIVFSKLESNFIWRFRPAGNMLVIQHGKTSGSSVGLTFGGIMNRGTKEIDVSGTIIPMTEINSILSKIPLLGNILGGETGLIAATYTFKGPTSDPKVSVNPLSVLAPGFLRNILFEGGFSSESSTRFPEEDKKPAAPVKSAPPAKNKAKEGVNR